jgi:DedD protein
MANRPDAPEPSVDELRRKARRRLVGAVVLALAAAVVLPLLLENEPKPLGDEVSIQIPPIDSGRFVNQLSPAGQPDGTKDKAGSAAGAPKALPGGAKAEPPAAAPSAPADASPPGAAASSAPAKAVPAQNTSGAEATPGAKPAPSDTKAALPETRTAPEGKATELPREARPDANAATGADAKTDAAKAAGPFVVQVAAFSDGYGARSLVLKLKKGGFPGYTETVATAKGTMHRVRVGPYPSREVADAARARLKAAGYAGVVARSG